MRTMRSLIQAKNRPDDPETVEYRTRFLSASRQAQRETAERFPTITPDNAQAAIDYQEMRIRELMNVKPTPNGA